MENDVVGGSTPEEEEEERINNWVDTYWVDAQLQLARKRRAKGMDGSSLH